MYFGGPLETLCHKGPFHPPRLKYPPFPKAQYLSISLHKLKVHIFNIFQNNDRCKIDRQLGIKETVDLNFDDKAELLIQPHISIAPCGKGKYHDTAYGICKPCPADQYQPNEGQPSCIACQDGFTSNANHDGCVKKG